jgi:hypothetical protein
MVFIIQCLVSTYRAISTNTHGATTSASKRRTAFSYFFFGRRFDFFFSGVAAFFKSAKKSPRVGTGISAPCFVCCIFAMNHPLDGARLKIVRAQEHLDSLKAEIRMYLDEQPHEVRSQPETHTRGRDQTNFYAYYAQTNPVHSLPPLVPGVPPLRLSTIIGDCVTNARAALDYIVWELAQRHFKPPFNVTDRNDRRIVAFPIYPSASDAGLKDRLNRLTDRQIPAGAIKEIEATQPYNAGYESLGWLHELVNRDKHRMPLLTVGQFDEMTVTFATPAIFVDLTKEPSTLTIPRDAATQNPPMQSNVQMKGEVAIYVTWQDVLVPRVAIERTLEQIIERVANTIPRFDPFF